MLIRSVDDGSPDETRWRSFVEAQGFGHFVASGHGRTVPVIVPTQFLFEGDHVVFHLAASNPVFACLAENRHAVLSVAGDWAYVPGAWKALGAEDPRRGIPTTYYGAVQLTGEAVVHDDPAEVSGILRRQLAALEPDGDYVDPLEHGAMLQAIRGIYLEVTEVRAKFKFGGNVDQSHRDHVAARLARRQGPGDSAALEQLSRRS